MSNNNQAQKPTASSNGSEGSNGIEEIDCPGFGKESESNEETKNKEQSEKTQGSGLKRDESVINLEKEAN